MKCFIVSLGIIIMGVSGLVFNWDMITYYNTRTHLKALTESCAACGALSFSEHDLYSNNDIVYEQTDVLNSMKYFVSHASKDLYCFQNGVLDIEDFSADSELDLVQVTISYTSNTDFFRSAFKTETVIVHTSCYQWNSYVEGQS